MIRRWEAERREGMAAVKSVVVVLVVVAGVAVVVVAGCVFGPLAAYSTAAVLVLGAYVREFRARP